MRVKRNYSEILFAFLGALATLDIVVLISSPAYRSAYGSTSDIADVLWRFALDAVLIIFYWTTYWRMIRGAHPKMILLSHALIYSVLSLLMCIPWGGHFFAPLTAVALPYLGSILWIAGGYFLSLAVAVAFFVSNLYLFIFATKSHK